MTDQEKKDLEIQLAELKKNLDERQVKISKASANDGKDEMYKQQIDSLYSYINMLDRYNNESIARLWNRIYEHESGHLPKIQTPSQMKNAISVLGLSEDYEVQKRIVYASQNGKWNFKAAIK